MYQDTNNSDKQLSKILSNLDGLRADMPSEAAQKRMKQRIMSEISRPIHAESLFHEAFRAAEPAPDVMARMKERIFAAIEAGLVRPWNWFMFARRAVGSTLVLTIVVSMAFLGVQDRIPTTYAKQGTLLENLSGTVTILRNDQSLLATEDFTLEQGDIVATGVKSHVTIRYFDNSVTRLDQNTQLLLDVLKREENGNGESSFIELNLQSGHMWSRVLSSVSDDYHFSVRVGNVKAEAQKKSAFDISALPNGSLEMQVYHNVVDVVAQDQDQKVVRSVVNGYKATVQQASLAPVLVKANEVRQDVWATENLQQDEQYVGKIVADQKKAREQSVAVLPSTIFYPVKTLGENAKLLVTFDAVEKETVKLNFAKRRFVEASILVDQNHLAEAQEALKSYQDTIVSVSDKIKQLESSDPEKAQKLRDLMDGLVGDTKQSLQVVTPDQPLYALKQSVLATEIAIAPSDTERQKLTLEHTADDLLDVQDLATKGKGDLAEEKIKDFQKASQSALTDIQTLPADSRNAAINDVLTEQKDALKVLTGIEQNTTLVNVADTAKQVRQDSLNSIQQTVSEVSVTTANPDVKEIVQEVKTVTQTYTVAPVVATPVVASETGTAAVTIDVAAENSAPVDGEEPFVGRVLPPKFQLKESTK